MRKNYNPFKTFLKMKKFDIVALEKARREDL